jgi:hypothetical protein
MLFRGRKTLLRKRVAVLEARMNYRDRQGINEVNRRIDHLAELVAEHDRVISDEEFDRIVTKRQNARRDNRDNSESK